MKILIIGSFEGYPSEGLSNKFKKAKDALERKKKDWNIVDPLNHNFITLRDFPSIEEKVEIPESENSLIGEMLSRFDALYLLPCWLNCKIAKNIVREALGLNLEIKEIYAL